MLMVTGSQRAVVQACKARVQSPRLLSDFLSGRRQGTTKTAASPSSSLLFTRFEQRRFFWGFGKRVEESGLLCLPGLHKPPNFLQLAETAVRDAEAILKDANTSPGRPRVLVNALDSVSNLLCKVADSAELIRNVHPKREWRDAADQAVVRVSSFIDSVNLDETLYESLRSSENSSELGSLTEEEKIVLKNMREAMEQQGVHLTGDAKNECLFLLAKSTEVCFSITSHDERASRETPVTGGEGQDGSLWVEEKELLEAGISPEEVASLPRIGGASVLSSSPSAVICSLDPDGLVAQQLLYGGKNATLRQKVFEAQNRKVPNKEQGLLELLTCRQRLAQMRGYRDWKTFALRESVVRQPECVVHFLRKCVTMLEKGLVEELRALAALKADLRRERGEGDGETLGVLCPWDIPFLTSVYKDRHFRDVASEMQNFLSLQSLLDGVQVAFRSLFGLELHREIPLEGEVWHFSVLKYSVRDPSRKEGQALGTLYLDLFSRFPKNIPSAQFTLVCSKDLSYEREREWPVGGSLGKMHVINIEGFSETAPSTQEGEANQQKRPWQMPATALVSDFYLDPSAFPQGLPEDSRDREKTLGELLRTTRLNVSSAKTFFHELGHVTHSLLSRTNLQHLAGTRGAIDFVEFPSHLFEHFVTDPGCLKMFARDAQGNPPSEDLLGRFSKGRHLFGHLEAMQQVVYALADQAFYSIELSADGQSVQLEPGRLQKHIEESLGREAVLGETPRGVPSQGTVVDLVGLPAMTSFDHLVHYGGSYYCYIFCRILAAHVWKEEFSRDPWGREVGQRLRQMFAQGSLESSLRVVRQLLEDEKQLSLNHDMPEEIPLQPFLSELESSLPQGEEM
uniref:CRIB domain-containing protein n=1 Tax=Chromera velia CCMP2878 TaxID=1169474 RepID=A0A0G4HQR6_9ALVE|eukprot:Cvel_7977.t1-p1 / transcript=Cvel_7977.t1 / gene=Cvel_7977 / organism=Chromera_velia_CCMP2878 / gene_product=Mitochondrial intermediate peptidase, putative / transcript_product=Mitochondrial intermediate peptidase, putative / location=Cvel_scaffold429:51686-58912(+) / protein_length=852 / sequence_SO=supercontig / SO=protein_coding / is_pseudo=false